MTEVNWKNWMDKFAWILEIAKKRNWDYGDLKIKAPIQERSIKSIEDYLGIVYPSDFKEILTKFSSGVWLNWQIEGEETEGECRALFCGGGRGYLWDYAVLIDEYKKYQEWIEICFPNPEDAYDKIWHHKVPFLSVPNGDMIVFGEYTPTGHPVIYLSHDGSDFHGSRLGENFIDFINRWSTIGCVGTEDWQLEPFYDETKQILKKEGQEIDNWKTWLEK